MKKTKLFFTLFGAALVVAFSSCTKDYTCTCTETGGGGDPYTETWTYKNVTKGQAKANCVSSSTTEDNETYTRDCKLN